MPRKPIHRAGCRGVRFRFGITNPGRRRQRITCPSHTRPEVTKISHGATELDGAAFGRRYNTAPRLTERLHSKGEKLKRVVFVCTQNANRSQMAEAFARRELLDTLE